MLLHFDSRLNYMKRGFSGSQTLNFTGANFEELEHKVQHNLGYIPQYIVGSNIDSTSVIWSTDIVPLLVSGAPVDVEPRIKTFINETELTIRLINGIGSGLQNGQRNVYWAIYLDYGGIE